VTRSSALSIFRDRNASQIIIGLNRLCVCEPTIEQRSLLLPGFGFRFVTLPYDPRENQPGESRLLTESRRKPRPLKFRLSETLNSQACRESKAGDDDGKPRRCRENGAERKALAMISSVGHKINGRPRKESARIFCRSLARDCARPSRIFSATR